MSELSFDLSGRVALVTGGGSGLGAAISATLAAHGAQVVVADRDLALAEAVAADLPGARAVEMEVTDPASVAAAVDTLDRLDIVVNSAGITRLAPAEDLTLEQWQATIGVNLTGSFLVAQAAFPLLKVRGGRIVNLGSQAGTVAIDEHAAYTASKAGVVGLTKGLALEWGQHGITVNAISPTAVMTDMGKMAWAGEKGEAHKAEIPMHRFAEPVEIAAAVLYLVSDGAGMVNGTDHLVDGGYTIR